MVQSPEGSVSVQWKVQGGSPRRQWHLHASSVVLVMSMMTGPLAGPLAVSVPLAVGTVLRLAWVRQKGCFGADDKVGACQHRPQSICRWRIPQGRSHHARVATVKPTEQRSAPRRNEPNQRNLATLYCTCTPILPSGITMGFLDAGTPLAWPDSLAVIAFGETVSWCFIAEVLAGKPSTHRAVREHGIKQFLLTYNRVKDRRNDVLKWGDEVRLPRVRPPVSGSLGRRVVQIEYHLVEFRHGAKLTRISLTAPEVLAALELENKTKHLCGSRGVCVAASLAVTSLSLSPQRRPVVLASRVWIVDGRGDAGRAV